jgi:hypothetical protein
MAKDVLNQSRLSDIQEEVLANVIKNDEYKLTLEDKLVNKLDQYINLDRAMFSGLMTSFSLVMFLVHTPINTLDNGDFILSLPYLSLPIKIVLDYLVGWIMAYHFTKILIDDTRIHTIMNHLSRK